MESNIVEITAPEHYGECMGKSESDFDKSSTREAGVRLGILRFYTYRD